MQAPLGKKVRLGGSNVRAGRALDRPEGTRRGWRGMTGHRVGTMRSIVHILWLRDAQVNGDSPARASVCESTASCALVSAASMLRRATLSP